MFKKICLAVAAIFIIISCKSSVLNSNQFDELFEGEETTDVATTTLKKGTYGNTDIEKQNVVIRTMDDFERIWRELYSGRDPLPEMPVIDFETEMVVGAFAGQKPHGGYGVEISDVVRTDKLAVKVITTKPGDDCGVTMAINAPYHLVKIPRVEAPVTFYEVTEVSNCSD